MLFKILNNRSKSDIILLAVLWAAIILGLWIRLKGLGKWSLAVDEYYTVASSESILKYGIPRWDLGGGG